ncbi:hypothetical protein AALA80_17930 [Oscillospiraceae bacterium 50-60]
MKPETKARRDHDRTIWIEASRKAGKNAQLLALERVRDDPDSTPGQVLEAVKLIREIGGG